MNTLGKRTLTQRSTESENNEFSKKTKKCSNTSYFYETLKEIGLILKFPEKCTASLEAVHLIRSIKIKLEKHYNYPSNVAELHENLIKICENDDVFKHYLFPNIIKISDNGEEHQLNDSVIKILLNVPIIQPKLSDFIFQKAIDFAAQRKADTWIPVILKCFSSLDSIVDGNKISTNLIDLLDITSEKMIKLQIITAIPDIVGDQELDYIPSELSRILNKDHELIPAILDCLSYLNLSDDQFEQLQKKTLNMLMTFPKYNFFPNFVKFLLIPGRTTDNAYLEVVIGIRNALGWPENESNSEIATSQVLTAAAIRDSMISSKTIANSWLKVISMCKVHTDHKPIDFIILLELFTISYEKQKQVESVIKRQIKMDTLKENLLNAAFENFVPILKNNLKHLINLAYFLLKVTGDVAVQYFASQLCTLMLSKLEDHIRTVVAELLQIGLYSKQCLMNVLMILNDVAAKDISLLKCQSVHMLTILDRMDHMSLSEIRVTMNLICALAYNNENSDIRDDINMIIRKELSNSNPIVKIQGILAGIHAVKYLMATNTEKQSESTNWRVTILNDNNLKEATQIIELISLSTRDFPDMIVFFYDELSKIISSATYINKNFMFWLTDVLTDDFQENFIINTINKDKIGEVKLLMQYCLNEDSEMEDMIAVNIAGLVLNSEADICMGTLSPLFEVVQIIHSKLHGGDLSNIDALLGCPIVMPIIVIEEIAELEQPLQSKILDCLIYTVNWFRELLNAFSSQTDFVLRKKILRRIIQIEQLEVLIAEILTKTNVVYKPPICTFNVNKYKKEQIDAKNPQNSKQKVQKKNQDQTVLTGTTRSQATQQINKSYKEKLDILQNLPLRELNLNILKLVNIDLSSDSNSCEELTVKSLKYLLNSVNIHIQNIIVSKIKRKTFLSKQDVPVYDAVLAEKYVKSINEILSKLREHLQFISNYLDEHAFQSTENESGFQLTSEILQYLICLEHIFNMLTIYLKWVGFQNAAHSGLLKSSLRTIAGVNTVLPQNDLIDILAKHFHTYEKYCLQLSTAVSLTELIRSFQIYSNKGVLKILRDMSHNFLSIQWKTPDGVLERGLYFNQSMDLFTCIYLINSELLNLKKLALQLTYDVKLLKGRNDVLPTMKSISKANFVVLYRNLGDALNESIKKTLTKGMTNSEHLGLWKEVANILKYMVEIVRTLDSRNNLSVFFNKSLPVLKLFLSQGLPILKIELKSKMEEVIEILKILQQSTRFLQSLCCHSRLKKDTVLMSKVPFVRQLSEQLVYKVKAVLAASNCPQAFWMGNLKNKDIHGEIIATQQSIDSEESNDDCDDQLPEEDVTDDTTDDEMLNPDSKSLSDIL
ncbi:hypothetical protein K1T71_003474 [Dendrolimus kikuchii]|uniref:Uncharacterized protein n=1 Tax=Dendrolimus kikuchii TaxID=765133 RepID=A0ACC1DCC1_9NEOP|nr:hypothetical protein K1T71_003474 [Dendrolimus kikuchii]